MTDDRVASLAQALRTEIEQLPFPPPHRTKWRDDILMVSEKNIYALARAALAWMEANPVACNDAPD